ncbi:MAG: hypothetical protein ACK5YC_20025, partial [Planctomyces sp.]
QARTSAAALPVRCNLSPPPAILQHRYEACLEKSVRCGGGCRGTYPERQSWTRDAAEHDGWRYRILGFWPRAGRLRSAWSKQRRPVSDL